MKTKIFLSLLGAASMLTSCSNNEIIDGQEFSSDAVSFGTYVGNSRASVTDLGELQKSSFNVYAAYTENKKWDDTDANQGANFMYNDEVKYANDAWTYDGMKYWPEKGNVTFCAFAPGNSDNVTPNDSEPLFAYKVPDKVAEQEDLMADIQKDRTKANGKVQFKFDHILSKISFTGKLADDYTAKGATVKVTDFTVTYADGKVQNNATYTYSVDNTKATIWNLTAASATYMSGYNELTGTTEPILSTTASQINTNDNYLMLLPQETKKGALQATIKYTVSYGDEANNTHVEVENVAKVDLPAATWLPGKQYMYGFSISMSEVKFDDIKVNEWDSKECEIKQDDTTISTTGNTLKFRSNKSGTSSAVFNVVNAEKIAVEIKEKGRAAADFSYSENGNTITFSPANALVRGDDDKEAVATITITSDTGIETTYTIDLKQYAPATLMNGSEAVTNNNITLQFKSTGVVHSGIATYTVKCADQVGGTLATTDDFEITSSKSEFKVAAKNSLAAAGNTNKTLPSEKTIILTNGAGETTTYNVSATQYAAAYAKTSDGTYVASTSNSNEYWGLPWSGEGPTTKTYTCVNGTITDCGSFTKTGGNSGFKINKMSYNISNGGLTIISKNSAIASYAYVTADITSYNSIGEKTVEILYMKLKNK